MHVRDRVAVGTEVAVELVALSNLQRNRAHEVKEGAVVEGRGEAFNACGGRPHRVLEVVELICRLADSGVKPDVRGAGTPTGEIDRQWVDPTKLRDLTGWEPRFGLEEGLRRTIDWYRRHPVLP